MSVEPRPSLLTTHHPLHTMHPRPTDAELEILADIWQHGPSTVRQVHERISANRNVGATTILKLMQIMTEKNLLTRDNTVRPQVFSPARSQRATQKQMLGDLLERAFGNSSGSLVLQALSSRNTTAEEREQIRELLDSLEQNDHDHDDDMRGDA